MMTEEVQLPGYVCSQRVFAAGGQRGTRQLGAVRESLPCWCCPLEDDKKPWLSAEPVLAISEVREETAGGCERITALLVLPSGG